MWRMLIAAMFAVFVSGPVWGADERDAMMIFGAGSEKCTKFLGLYARSELKDVGSQIQYSSDFGFEIGWIQGYMTAINVCVPGKTNHFEPMDTVDSIGWIASWCRDHPDEILITAMKAFVKTKVP